MINRFQTVEEEKKSLTMIVKTELWISFMFCMLLVDAASLVEVEFNFTYMRMRENVQISRI